MINLASAQATGLAGSRKVTGMDNGRPEPDPPGRGLPLAGLVVVSVEQAVAAPYATRQLADLGARVIKVERPGSGDFARGYDKTVHGQSSYFTWLNRGKESVVLDVKDPADRALLTAVIDRADIP
jgi:itaconate CoA-transferase